MALTDAEKDRVAYHLGYPVVEQGVGLGMAMPTLVSVMYPVYGALNHLRETAVEQVRRLIAFCDNAENQMSECLTRMQASKVDGIVMRADEFQALEAAYQSFRQRLASAVGAPINPMSPAVESANIERTW